MPAASHTHTPLSFCSPYFSFIFYILLVTLIWFVFFFQFLPLGQDVLCTCSDTLSCVGRVRVERINKMPPPSIDAAAPPPPAAAAAATENSDVEEEEEVTPPLPPATPTASASAAAPPLLQPQPQHRDTHPLRSPSPSLLPSHSFRPSPQPPPPATSSSSSSSSSSSAAATTASAATASAATAPFVACSSVVELKKALELAGDAGASAASDGVDADGDADAAGDLVVSDTTRVWRAAKVSLDEMLCPRFRRGGGGGGGGSGSGGDGTVPLPTLEVAEAKVLAAAAEDAAASSGGGAPRALCERAFARPETAALLRDLVSALALHMHLQVENARPRRRTPRRGAAPGVAAALAAAGPTGDAHAILAAAGVRLRAGHLEEVDRAVTAAAGGGGGGGGRSLTGATLAAVLEADHLRDLESEEVEAEAALFRARAAGCAAAVLFALPLPARDLLAQPYAAALGRAAARVLQAAVRRGAHYNPSAVPVVEYSVRTALLWLSGVPAAFAAPPRPPLLPGRSRCRTAAAANVAAVAATSAEPATAAAAVTAAAAARSSGRGGGGGWRRLRAASARSAGGGGEAAAQYDWCARAKAPNPPAGTPDAAWGPAVLRRRRMRRRLQKEQPPAWAAPAASSVRSRCRVASAAHRDGNAAVLSQAAPPLLPQPPTPPAPAALAVAAAPLPHDASSSSLFPAAVAGPAAADGAAAAAAPAAASEAAAVMPARRGGVGGGSGCRLSTRFRSLLDEPAVLPVGFDAGRADVKRMLSEVATAAERRRPVGRRARDAFSSLLGAVAAEGPGGVGVGGGGGAAAGGGIGGKAAAAAAAQKKAWPTLRCATSSVVGGGGRTAPFGVCAHSPYFTVWAEERGVRRVPPTGGRRAEAKLSWTLAQP